MFLLTRCNLVGVTNRKVFKEYYVKNIMKNKSIEEFVNQHTFDVETLIKTMPGAFNTYDAVKKKSSDIELAANSGVIKKVKKRRKEKTFYEYASLAIWNELLNRYSQQGDLNFNAPKPLGFVDFEDESQGILMSFIPGYEIKKLNILKRSTPVRFKGQRYPVPLYPACSLHLGALNQIKENEEIVHNDYAPRHIIFSPSEEVYIGVVDVENSFQDKGLAKKESEYILERFRKLTSSPRDSQILDSWYDQGKEIIGNKTNYLPEVIEEVEKKMGLSIDFGNMKVGDYSIQGFR